MRQLYEFITGEQVEATEVKTVLTCEDWNTRGLCISRLYEDTHQKKRTAPRRDIETPCTARPNREVRNSTVLSLSVIHQSNLKQ